MRGNKATPGKVTASAMPQDALDPPGGGLTPQAGENASQSEKRPCAIYARNSKPPKGWRPSFQGEEPPTSWTFQVAKARARATADGFAVVLDEHDIATGSDPNRPGWESIMSAVRGGRVRRVYATKLDRCMRGVKHFKEVEEVFEARGCELVFTDSPGASILTRDPFSKATRGVIAVFAELELDLARERSMDVLEVREDGRLYGPRSERPSGRPQEYGDGHKFRTRNGRPVHDAARCRLCRGETPGVQGEAKNSAE